MKVNLNVDVHHLTRVEGHGNIKIRVKDGQIEEAKWVVVETPRYFEVMLKGKHFSTAPILAARICGICSISHCLTSLRATEAAFGVVIPETAAKLRMLAKHAETLQSHSLHVFFLAAPDFFGLPNAIALLDKESRAYDLAHRLRALSRQLTERALSGSGPPPVDRKQEVGSAEAAEISYPVLRTEIERALVSLTAAVAPGLDDMPTARLLMEKRPEIFQIARRVKGLANRLCDAVAGRTTHPVSLQPGGVAVVPDKQILSAFRHELSDAIDDLGITAELFASLSIPDFSRETEHVSLKGNGEYPFIGGRLVSSDGVEKEESDYLAMTNEYVTEENTTKWSKLSRDAYAVGALARFNNNAALLHPEAARVARALKLEPVCHNPYLINVAQLVECVHAVYESIRIIDELLDAGPAETMAGVTPREGEGVGAVEAPRGILFHHYEYDRQGRIRKANCVVPTTQNNGNIHRDLPELARAFAKPGVTDADLELLASMLVRAYDPCISCSVH